jgi:hypothetical protein
MENTPRTDLFHGLFALLPGAQGRGRLASNASAPHAIPDPQTGRPVRVASTELSERGVCPACAEPGSGGYVSFVSDLRLAFACPHCEKLTWIAGA